MISVLLQTVLSKTEIAVFNDQVKIASVVKESLQKSNNTFVCDIASCLHQFEMNITDVGCVWIINGPGYYTGIRIGLAIGKGIADPLQIPVRLVNTFHWLYEGVSSGNAFTKLFIPSSKREGFLAFMHKDTIEEIRFVSVSSIQMQEKEQYASSDIYCYANTLSFGHNISEISSLPGNYNEVSDASDLLPNYMKSEDDLFVKKS